MTEHEAANIHYAFENGYQFPFGNGDPDKCDWDEVRKHEELLREALEKRIPKNPIPDFYYTPRWWGYCPSCEGKREDGLGNDTVRRGTKFCENCGQALDWSDYYE